MILAELIIFVMPVVTTMVAASAINILTESVFAASAPPTPAATAPCLN